MKIQEVLLKEPFKRALPCPTMDEGIGVSDGRMAPVISGVDIYTNISQDTFLREYFVTGHKIFSPSYYMDRIKTDDNGKSYIYFVERVGVPFQRVIVTKRLTHLCGNNIEFKAPKGNHEDLQDFKQGWIDKNMEVAWFESAKSASITGDCAFCGYFDRDGKFKHRTFSYLKGDILYPHYDPTTGELAVFGRGYKLANEEGNTSEYLDVYDSVNVATYRRKSYGVLTAFVRKTMRFEDEWEVVYAPKPHGFPFIPIAYHRNEDGAAWSPVQELIDKLEIAISQLAENNKTYAFRILFLKGDNVDTKLDADGQPVAVVGDKDSDAKFLERADVSTSFELQIKYYLQWIFMGSFTVLPPELKSGDLPGVAIKLLYSPAVEKAMEDSQEWNPFIDDMVRIFKIGWGRERGKSAQMDNLNARGEIIPYVHQNDTEIVSNLNSSVLAGTLSAKTASERHPEAEADEYDRIEEEKKMELSAPADGMNNYNRAEEALKTE